MLLAVADNLVRSSVWIIGGDGWAYDIGYGGLDHVLASGRDVNVLVLDTEVYSNTGGQMSKSTPRGAVAKFAAGGKPLRQEGPRPDRHELRQRLCGQRGHGRQGRAHAQGLPRGRVLPGPSLIIAYSHCIAHGIDLDRGVGAKQQSLAVDSGQWLLYRYDPRRADTGENPLQLDSAAAKAKVQDYLLSENRFKMLTKSKPEDAKTFFEQAQEDAERRWQLYAYLAGPQARSATAPPPGRKPATTVDQQPRPPPATRASDPRINAATINLRTDYGSHDHLPGPETAHPAGALRLAAVGGDRQHQADGRRRRRRRRAALALRGAAAPGQR